MATPSNDIFGVNGSEIKKLPDQELLTHFETLASSSARGRERRGQGYFRNAVRQEILLRMKNNRT